MTHTRREKMCSNSKDTRWDRIRKRQCSANSSANIKSETIKRFIEIDYIGRHHKELLNGSSRTETKLDPAMVMDLRHEMFKQIPRKLPLATVAQQQKLDICKTHNIAVEEHYIENQLQQFRQHLRKQSKRNKISEKKVHSLLIDNRDIMQSLTESQRHIEDFYTTPIEALAEANELFKKELDKGMNYTTREDIQESVTEETFDMQLNKEEKKHGNPDILNEHTDKDSGFLSQQIGDNKCSEDVVDIFPELLPLYENDKKHENLLRQGTPSPLADTDEILRPLRNNIAQNVGFHLRCVRFEEDVDVHQFDRDSCSGSNTSDGIDSVISELAEEAWLELQIEEDSNVKIMAVNDICEKKLSGGSPKEMRNTHLSSQPKIMQDSGSMETPLIVTGKVSEIIKRLPEDTNPQLVSPSLTETDEENEKEGLINNEQCKIIEQLFQTKPTARVPIMRKYFLKWIHFTNIERIEREHVNSHADRVRKINIFLDKIRLEKSRLKKCQSQNLNGRDDEQNVAKKDVMGNIQINKKYQNKIKVQQDIIDLQRLKLERQERIIMELKLSKLSEEAREARLELKNELKSVMRSGDAKSKAKAKCLQLVGNLRDEEDDTLDRLQGRAMLMPKFLQSMQERALERSIRHEQAKQRRLQQEAEREAQKLAIEEAKRQEDEEAKRVRIEALKEKRRQEKMAKIMKERERQRYLDNIRKAQEFHRRLLLKRIGMEGFKRLLQRKKNNMQKCEILRRSIYKKTYFQAWFSLYRILKARRYQKAVELHERILKRIYIHFWLFYVGQERSKYNVAVDYHEMKLTETTFTKWFAYTKRMQIIEETKMKQAQSHHEWTTKWKVLDCWQRLPQILKLEKETEERRQRWRLKIWELLPDYTPNRDELNFI